MALTPLWLPITTNRICHNAAQFFIISHGCFQNLTNFLKNERMTQAISSQLVSFNFD